MLLEHGRELGILSANVVELSLESARVGLQHLVLLIQELDFGRGLGQLDAIITCVFAGRFQTEDDRTNPAQHNKNVELTC